MSDRTRRHLGRSRQARFKLRIPTALTNHRCERSVKFKGLHVTCSMCFRTMRLRVLRRFSWVACCHIPVDKGLFLGTSHNSAEARCKEPPRSEADISIRTESQDLKESGDGARHVPRVPDTVARGVSARVPRPLRHGGRQSPPRSTRGRRGLNARTCSDEMATIRRLRGLEALSRAIKVPQAQ